MKKTKRQLVFTTRKDTGCKNIDSINEKMESKIQVSNPIPKRGKALEKYKALNELKQLFL